MFEYHINNVDENIVVRYESKSSFTFLCKKGERLFKGSYVPEWISSETKQILQTELNKLIHLMKGGSDALVKKLF